MAKGEIAAESDNNIFDNGFDKRRIHKRLQIFIAPYFQWFGVQRALPKRALDYLNMNVDKKIHFVSTFMVT